jgi:glutathione S-transferase
MLEVFHAPRSRSVRVVWACEEMGLPYKVLPIEFGQPRPAEFLRANPSGTLPAVRDGETVMTESVAIIQYLADRHGPTPLALRPEHADYADYLQFLFLGEAGLAAPLNAVIGTRFFAPEAERKGNWTVEMVIGGFHNRMKLVDRRLAGHAYMAGDDFSLADISVGYAIGLANMLGLNDGLSEAAQAYYQRVTDRPAYHRAMGG